MCSVCWFLSVHFYRSSFVVANKKPWPTIYFFPVNLKSSKGGTMCVLISNGVGDTDTVKYWQLGTWGDILNCCGWVKSILFQTVRFQSVKCEIRVAKSCVFYIYPYYGVKKISQPPAVETASLTDGLTGWWLAGEKCWPETGEPPCKEGHVFVVGSMHAFVGHRAY